MRRSIMISSYSAMLVGLMVVLISCIPPVALPDFVALRDLACEQKVIQTNEQLAAQINKTGLIFWTWHMNFRAFEPFNPQRPLACFRLYGRANPSDPFESIDNGGMLVDKCQVVGNVTFDQVYLPYGVHGNKLTNTSVDQAGRATFQAGGYIRCSDFSVRRLAEQAHRNFKVAPAILPGLRQLTGTNRQTYESFTVIAAGNVTATNPINPVLYYQPTLETDPRILADIASGAITDPDSATYRLTRQEDQLPLSVGFFLPEIDPPIHTFAGLLLAEPYKPSDHRLPECSFASEVDYFWWMDYAGYRASQEFYFVKHEIGTGFPGKSILDKPCPPEGTIGTPPRDVTFWTGESEIYIGCKPAEAEADGCDSTLPGVLYGVTIDPVESKTQPTS